MVGTFCILHLAGGTIDLMSLGGLAIAIGLVIDDAIVVVENIHRHRAAGETVAVAAEKGTQELIAAVTGSTLTTVVVFVPLGLLQGVVGQFFAALSLTLAAAVLLSLVYALLFIPNAGGALPARRGRSATARRPRLGWLSVRYQALLRRALGAPGARRAWSPWLFARRRRRVLHQPRDRLPARDGRGRLRPRLLDAGGHVAARDGPDGRPDRGGPDATRRRCRASRGAPGAELGLFATAQNTGDIVVRLKPPSAAVAQLRGGHRGAARHVREGAAGHDDRVRAAPAGHARRPRGQPRADRGEDLRRRPADAREAGRRAWPRR